MKTEDTMLAKDGKPYMHPIMAMHPANEWTQKAIDEAEKSLLRIMKSNIDFKNMDEDTSSWVRYHVLKELYKVADLNSAQLLLTHGRQMDEAAMEERESEDSMVFEEGRKEGFDEGYRRGICMGLMEGREEVYRRLEKERAENAVVPGATRRYLG